jgi:hypothetical protein
MYMKAVILSSPMHTLLHEAIENGGLTLERVLAIKQSTNGAILRRGYLKWDAEAKRGAGAFIPTELALAVHEQFTTASIERKGMYRPLSSAIRDRSILSTAKILRDEYKEAYDAEQQRERKPRKRSKKEAA